MWATPLLSLFLALSLLLVVAGDVETNPGPVTDELLAQVDDSVLTCEDLYDVCQEMHTLAAKWSHIGFAVHIPSSQEEAIRATRDDSASCLRMVLKKWLQKSYSYDKYGPPTWRMLVKAVGDPLGGDDCALAETIANKHPVKVPTKPLGDPRESHHLCRMFSTTFTKLTKMLDASAEISELKEFLESYCHPLYPEQTYVNSQVYGNAATTKELLKSLFPRYINYMHYYLLEDIVVTFGCDKAKGLLQQYTDQKCSQMRRLDDQPGPITNEEIEQFHGVKKLKVQVEGDTSDATVEIIGEIQKVLEKASGIKQAVITYALYDPGSVLLTFLIPESIFHIFHELNTEDLTILADSGVMKLEIDGVVIDNIQQYYTVKSQLAVDSGERTKPTGLECFLKEKVTEVTSERYLHLLKMLHSVETRLLSDVCSEKFLKTFSKDLQDWKKLAPYLSIQEWKIEELEYKYPDKDDQKYQALLWWKKAEGSTATHYNLLESLILHGNIREVEALLKRLGEGPVVLHARRWLKQQYLAHDSWQQWREVPNLIQFDQRLGELTTQASEQLKNIDYSNCCYDIQIEFPSIITPVSMKSLVNACTSSDHPWSSKSCILIKGAPGQGKSFLLSKLCQYWALGYGMRSMTLMFWIDCSQFQRRTTFHQLLSQLLPIETWNICKWIENKQGKDVVFLLDGYDQQQQNGPDLWTGFGVTWNVSNNVFYDLVSRTFLPKSVVLITSTYKPNEIRFIQVKQLELLNLTDHQISKQVLQFFSFRPAKVEEFHLYLTNNPDMNLLASSPVYLYTLLFVCNKLLDTPSHELPVTWTELFTNVMLLLLPSTFPKPLQIETPPGSLSQLPSTVQTFLRELSTEAFETLTTEFLDLALPAARFPGHKSRFAQVHPCTKPLYHCEKQCFQFSSPLLQQFLAALHVHSLSLAKQTRLMVDKSELNFLWQFFAGLLVSESCDRFLSLRNTYHQEKMKMLATCAYETDRSCDMPSVFRDYILTPADIHHITISGLKFPPELLNFKRCCFGKATLFQLTRQVHVLAQSGQQGFKVNFEDCTFSPEGLWSLAAAPFEKLRFCGVSIEDLCGLAMGLKKCRWVKGLKCLDLGWNEIGDFGATVLANALRVNQSLKTLNLGGNGIRDSGATALADALKVKQSLTTLNLWDNKIGDSGATALADALRVDKSLRSLNLSHNNLTGTGAIALAISLQHNKSMEELNLGRNGIGDCGATALAAALRVNKKLKTLNLWENRIGDSGATALADALRVNQSLETLELGGLWIPMNISESTKQLLRDNERIIVLVIYGDDHYNDYV